MKGTFVLDARMIRHYELGEEGTIIVKIEKKFKTLWASLAPL